MAILKILTMKIHTLLAFLSFASFCFGGAKIYRVGWDSSAEYIIAKWPVEATVLVSYEGGVKDGEQVWWQKDGRPLPDKSGAALIIENAKFDDSGLYTPWIGEDVGSARPGQGALVLVGPGDQLVNYSTRLKLKDGDSHPVIGFVIERGVDARFVMIRCIGPGLERFGIPGYGRAREIILRRGDGVIVHRYEVPDGDLRGYMARKIEPKVGAFSLVDGDVAGFRILESGVYTAEIVPREGSDGEVLVEYYIFSD